MKGCKNRRFQDSIKLICCIVCFLGNQPFSIFLTGKLHVSLFLYAGRNINLQNNRFVGSKITTCMQLTRSPLSLSSLLTLRKTLVAFGADNLLIKQSQILSEAQYFFTWCTGLSDSDSICFAVCSATNIYPEMLNIYRQKVTRMSYD